MRVLILAYTLETYATERLTACFRGSGHEVFLASPLECSLEITKSGTAVLHRGVALPDMDAVILRGLTYIDQGIPVPRVLETAMAMPFLRGGSVCVNTPTAKLLATNKLGTIQELANRGLPVPATFLVWNSEELDRVLGQLGSPVILKTLDGTWGVGVMRCDSEASARSIFETLRTTGQPIMVQEYIEESRGEDVRVMVLGDRVLASMRRIPRKGEFRSNIGRGASAQHIELSQAQEALAVGAARAIGLDIAGVDLLDSARGPLVLEANPVPGLETLDRVCSVDSATEIAAYVEARCSARRE